MNVSSAFQRTALLNADAWARWQERHITLDWPVATKIWAVSEPLFAAAS